MKLLFRYLKKYKWLIVCNLIAAFGFVLIELGLPTLLAKIIDDGIIVQNFEKVKFYGFCMFMLVVVGSIGRIFLSYLVTRITNHVVKDMRINIFRKTRTFSASEINHFGVSSLMTRTNNDVYQVMLFLQMALRIGFITPIMIVSSLYMCIRTSPSLSATLLVAFPLLIIAVVFTAIVTEPISREQQQSLDGINRIMREDLTGLRVIRAFVREKFQQNRFETTNERYTTLAKRMNYFMALANPAFGLLFAGIIVAVLWIGTNLITNNTIMIGNLTAFIDYIFHTLFSFMLFTMLFAIYPKTIVSLKRIKEVLETEPTIANTIDGVTTTKRTGYVEFKNVSFSYPDDPENYILENISFTASPGETVAFIGSTGSGKSSLVQLIPRFHDVATGSILVDGVDVRDFNNDALRQKIGYVPQKSVLFTGTIADNLRFGKDTATQADLEKAAQIAYTYDFIMSKPENFEYYLSEGGANLSGGQKQRLAIARAFVRQPEIYVFDDAFSALDYQTDAKLREAMKPYTQTATVLIVAQRVGTIINADKIIVLDEGRIVGVGTHQELLRNCQTYYEIASSQLAEEELV